MNDSTVYTRIIFDLEKSFARFKQRRFFVVGSFPTFGYYQQPETLTFFSKNVKVNAT